MILKKRLFVFVLVLLSLVVIPSISSDVVNNNTQENEISSSIGLVVSPKEINLNLVASTDSKETSTVTKVVRITNYLGNITTINITQTDLDNIIFIDETFFNLFSGESKDINVVFTAPTQAGIFTGKILIEGEVVLVTLNVNPNLLLFDSNIVVLNKDYQVKQGRNLRTQITLAPTEEQERLEVTLKFEVKDYNGKVWFEKNETLLLEEQITINRKFDLGEIPIGEYMLSFNLISLEEKTLSNIYFEIIPPSSSLFKSSAILLILVIIILIVSILVKKRKTNN